MLLITIIAGWILVLALVTALCLAASRGDAQSEGPASGSTSELPRESLGAAAIELVQADPEAAAAAIAAVRARREHHPRVAPVARVGSAVG
jgi:hypothetical protein